MPQSGQEKEQTRLPERIYKLQPDRTLHLRGFDSFAAAASIHHATPTGFEVSGIFRDPADFAVAVLYDADNFFEHPSIKYLPDFDFSGLTLNFTLQYSDSVQPIDSPKYSWIDWATLDVIRPDGTAPKFPYGKMQCYRALLSRQLRPPLMCSRAMGCSQATASASGIRIWFSTT